MSHGWLARRPDIERGREWFGLELKPDLETRWEEFQFAKDVLTELPLGRVLDAGCGFEPRVHVMPEIAARLGWQVDALDLRLPMHGMIDHPLITRNVGDLTATEYEAETFDVVLCISVIEHLASEDRVKFWTEAARVLKPGGVLVVTMDGAWPRQMELEALFDVGAPWIPLDLLKTGEGVPVSYVIGLKRG